MITEKITKITFLNDSKRILEKINTNHSMEIKPIKTEYYYNQALKRQLIKGEKSGFIKDFDRDVFLKNLKEEHSKNELEDK
jgi:hypothetical protein